MHDHYRRGYQAAAAPLDWVERYSGIGTMLEVNVTSCCGRDEAMSE